MEDVDLEGDEHKLLQRNLIGRVTFLFFTQGLLAFLVGKEVISSDIEVWYTYTTVNIVFARFMCGIVLHVSLSGELKTGMNLMKYAVNHPWKFDRVGVAYLCGLMQATNVIIVEGVNFVALLTNFKIIDVIMNFMALVVIAEFDEYFFNALKNHPLVDIATGEDPYGEFLVW